MLKTLLKNSLILGFVEFFIRAKSVAVLPLMTFYLGPEGFGTWSQVLAISAFSVPFVMIGTDSSLLRYLPGEDKDAQVSSFFAWLISIIALCFFISIIFIYFSKDISNIILGDSNKFEYILLVPLLLISNILLNAIKIWFRLANQISNYSYFIIWQTTISLLLSFIFVKCKLSLYYIIFLLAMTDCLLACIGLLLIFWHFGKFLMPKFNMQLKFLRYGAPLFLSGISMWVLNYSDRFILPKFVSPQDVGVYVLTYQLGAISAQVLTTPIWTQFQSLVSKQFNDGNISRCEEIFSFSITVICFLGIPMVVGLFVMSRDILLLFAPSGFLGGAYVIPIVALSYLFHIVASCFEVGLGLYHKQNIITSTSIIVLVLNIAFNLILIPFWGIAGAALATLLSFFMQFIIAFHLTKKFNLFKVPLALYIKIIFASAIMGLIIKSIDTLIPSTLIGRAFEVIFGILLYLLLTLFLRVISIDFFRSILR